MKMNLRAVVEQRDELIGRVLTTRTRKKEFLVVAISERGISVRPQGSKSVSDRPIRALEIDLMGAKWSEFKAGSITRSELANGSPQIFNTSYIESVFNAIEDMTGHP